MTRRRYFDLTPGQTVEVGQNTTITLEAKTGRRARLRIETDEPTQLQRAQAPQIQRAAPQPEQPPGFAGLLPPARRAG